MGVALAGAVVFTAAPAEALSPTHFGFQTTAYGTRVMAHDVQLRSGRTAFSFISCTRLAGRSAKNYIADLNVPQDNPAVHVKGVSSFNHTFRHPKHHAVGVRGRNVIASAVIGDPNGAHIAVKGLRTVAVTAHRPSGWVTRTHIKWADLNIVPATGTPLDGAAQQLIDATNKGVKPVLDVLNKQAKPVEIPGVGSIAFGWERRTGDKFPRRAAASAYALRIKLYGQDGTKGTDDDSLVALGRAWSHMTTGMPAGVMHGIGYAAQIDVAGGLAKVGKVAARPLACPGTRGHVWSNHTAGLDLANAGALKLGALSGKAFGVQHRNGRARAWTEGSVASVELGTGDQKVVIKGIVGRAHVRQAKSGKVFKNRHGSTIGSLSIGGQKQSIPKPGQDIEIPGLAKIKFFPTHRTHRGIRVTAVRITLLDGTPGDSVINLGNARARITRV